MSNIEALVREARELDMEIAELTEKKSALVERIRAELKPGDSGSVDGVKFSLRAGNRRFDHKLALKAMTKAMKERCIVTTFDQKVVRQVAEEIGILDQCMVTSDSAKPVLSLTS